MKAAELALLDHLERYPYIPEVDDDPRLDEQDHQLEDPAVEAAFARLAPGHPKGVRA
jgi:hypothetical protein